MECIYVFHVIFKIKNLVFSETAFTDWASSWRLSVFCEARSDILNIIYMNLKFQRADLNTTTTEYDQ
jgi:hypothetical protein